MHLSTARAEQVSQKKQREQPICYSKFGSDTIQEHIMQIIV